MIEIERKFLIRNVESIGFEVGFYPKKRFLQAYISTDPTIRVRNEGGEYVLCVKGGGGMAHEEFELELSQSQFDKLWKKRETNAVEKDRYFIPLKTGHTAELDIYFGELSGLVTVEVEFDTLAEAEGFIPPKWFGMDITHDFRYKNTSLSKFGLPE